MISSRQWHGIGSRVVETAGDVITKILSRDTKRFDRAFDEVNAAWADVGELGREKIEALKNAVGFEEQAQALGIPQKVVERMMIDGDVHGVDLSDVKAKIESLFAHWRAEAEAQEDGKKTEEEEKQAKQKAEQEEKQAEQERKQAEQKKAQEDAQKSRYQAENSAKPRETTAPEGATTRAPTAASPTAKQTVDANQANQLQQLLAAAGQGQQPSQQ